MKRFFHNNGLSVVLLLLFLTLWGAQAASGFKVHSTEAIRYGKEAGTFLQYLASGHFWQATGENWESEFLQMGAYVILTVHLFQRGSAESNDPDKAQALAKERRAKAARSNWMYRNSLSLAFLGLFLMAFCIHAAGGFAEFNEERVQHGEPEVSLMGFLTDAKFWFESLQNWQSEFLAVFSIVVMSIFLRQNGSPESKAVDAPNSETGG